MPNRWHWTIRFDFDPMWEEITCQALTLECSQKKGPQWRRMSVSTLNSFHVLWSFTFCYYSNDRFDLCCHRSKCHALLFVHCSLEPCALFFCSCEFFGTWQITPSAHQCFKTVTCIRWLKRRRLHSLNTIFCECPIPHHGSSTEWQEPLGRRCWQRTSDKGSGVFFIMPFRYVCSVVPHVWVLVKSSAARCCLGTSQQLYQR